MWDGHGCLCAPGHETAAWVRRRRGCRWSAGPGWRTGAGDRAIFGNHHDDGTACTMVVRLQRVDHREVARACASGQVDVAQLIERDSAYGIACAATEVGGIV